MIAPATAFFVIIKKRMRGDGLTYQNKIAICISDIDAGIILCAAQIAVRNRIGSVVIRHYKSGVAIHINDIYGVIGCVQIWRKTGILRCQGISHHPSPYFRIIRTIGEIQPVEAKLVVAFFAGKLILRHGLQTRPLRCLRAAAQAHSPTDRNPHNPPPRRFDRPSRALSLNDLSRSKPSSACSTM